MCSVVEERRSHYWMGIQSPTNSASAWCVIGNILWLPSRWWSMKLIQLPSESDSQTTADGNLSPIFRSWCAPMLINSAWIPFQIQNTAPPQPDYRGWVARVGRATWLSFGGGMGSHKEKRQTETSSSQCIHLATIAIIGHRCLSYYFTNARLHSQWQAYSANLEKSNQKRERQPSPYPSCQTKTNRPISLSSHLSAPGRSLSLKPEIKI